MNAKQSFKGVILIIFLLAMSMNASAWLFPTYDYRMPITWTNTGDLNFDKYIGYVDMNNNNFFWNTIDQNLNCIKFSDKFDLIDLNYSAIDKNYQNQKASFVIKLAPGQSINPHDSYTANMYFDANTSASCGVNNNEEGSWTFSDSFASTLPDYNTSTWTSTAGVNTFTTAGGTLTFDGDAGFSGVKHYARQLQINYLTNRYKARYFKSSETGTPAELALDIDYYLRDQNLFADAGFGNTGNQLDEFRIGDHANTLFTYSGATNTTKLVDYFSLRHVDGNPPAAIQLVTDFYRFVFYDDSNAGQKGLVQDINGLRKVQFVDELTKTAISPSVVLNGATLTTTSGTLDVNTSLYSFPYTLVPSLSGYDTRSFYFDTNLGFFEYSTLGLRTDTQSKDIPFEFFAPNDINKLTNRNIRVSRTGVLSGSGQTDSSGDITFNLAPQDGNYSFSIKYLGYDVNTEYIYSPVTVSVSQPRNELNNALISGFFNLDVGGLGLQNVSANSSWPYTTITILSNTKDIYSLRVDENSSSQVYYPRSYAMIVRGNDTSLSVQPYLIPITNAILVNYKIANIISGKTIPNIRVTLSTGINNVDSVVEDRVSDSAGIAQMSMIQLKNYNLRVTSANQDSNYFAAVQNILASGSSFTVWINLTNNSTITANTLDVNFAPTTRSLTLANNILDINARSNSNFNRIILQVLDGNVIENSFACTSSPCNTSFSVNLNNFDGNTATAQAIFEYDDYNYTIAKSYFFLLGAIDLVGILSTPKDILSPVSLVFIALFITLIFLVFMGSNPIGNNIGQAFVAVIIFGILAYFWFSNNTELMLGFFGAIFGAAIIYLWARNRQGG